MDISKRIAELYPTLSPKERREAEYNFRRYIEITMEIAAEQGNANQNHAIKDRGETA